MTAMNPNNCETCEHKQNADGGHCYMFRDAPTEVCMQHTGRRALNTLDALMAVFGMRRAEMGTEGR